MDKQEFEKWKAQHERVRAVMPDRPAKSKWVWQVPEWVTGWMSFLDDLKVPGWARLVGGFILLVFVLYLVGLMFPSLKRDPNKCMWTDEHKGGGMYIRACRFPDGRVNENLPVTIITK